MSPLGGFLLGPSLPLSLLSFSTGGMTWALGAPTPASVLGACWQACGHPMRSCWAPHISTVCRGGQGAGQEGDSGAVVWGVCAEV